jgi:hypothetical protein
LPRFQLPPDRLTAEWAKAAGRVWAREWEEAADLEQVAGRVMGPEEAKVVDLEAAMELAEARGVKDNEGLYSNHG